MDVFLCINLIKMSLNLLSLYESASKTYDGNCYYTLFEGGILLDNCSLSFQINSELETLTTHSPEMEGGYTFDREDVTLKNYLLD